MVESPEKEPPLKKSKADTISQIRKRDGRIVDFDREKIVNAVFKAAQSIGGDNRRRAELLADKVMEAINEKFHKRSIPAVEEIQDIIEDTLLREGHIRTAKAFISYRQKRSDLREAKKAELDGKIDEECPVSLNALTVLKKRYLLKDKDGKTIETPTTMWKRIANNIAQAERNYGTDTEKASDKFFQMMCKLEFLPNSPTIMNAGTDIQQLSACFVIPVEDSMEGIFTALKNAALIHKSGGGTGFSFSRLRPKNDNVKSTHGVSSGPISFMKVFDSATEAIKQGGKRRGANMGVLRIDHPDILEFINLKADGKTLNNFNISVGITNRFMEALEKNEDYELINPKDGSVAGMFSARAVFDNILTMAWKRGDPGLVFIDRVNEKNPVKHLGQIEATNPCGEQPLLPFESCNLGSVNLNKFMMADEKDMDWDRLRDAVHDAVHFLDNVIDMNKYPIPEIGDMSRKTRKIGLGMMGFADVLYRLGIPYDSDEGIAWGEKIMKFIFEEADKKSQQLAEERGCFPGYEGSDHEKAGIKRRNGAITTIAPTGTIGMIAEASGGLEPNFAICYIKNVMDGTQFVYANHYFEKIAKDRGFYSEALMRKIAEVGSLQTLDEIPDDVKRVFVTAQDITPEWHIKMQAAFQKWVDSSISKTINFPGDANIKDVETGYMLAWELGCKGVTIYRDGSLDNQVLNIATVKKTKEEKAKAPVPQTQQKTPKEMPKKEQQGIVSTNPDLTVQEAVNPTEAPGKEMCPECKSAMIFKEGCAVCSNCSFSYCS
ncbi:vitamin B12-dependent ribonucleotide reductase [Nanoarchaeota archaeon]